LRRAYRRAVAEFQRRIASDDELAARFETETNLVLVERVSDLRERLDTLGERLLTQAARNEDFRQLSSAYFDRTSPSPETCWRTTFGLADVHAGIPAERDGEAAAHEELLDALRADEDRLVVGRPGAGKSTLCKQVAVEWYRADGTGAVLYRESGRGGRPFESTAALSDAIDEADGHTLVVVEDAVREAANAILGVVEDHAADPGVSFLLDARESELDRFADGGATDRAARRLRENLDTVPPYPLPEISEADIERVVTAFEDATGRTVGRDAEALHEEVTHGDTEGFGAFLLLSFHLPVGGDTVDGDGAATGLEAHVAERYEALDDPAGDDSHGLSEFDPELVADIGVMVNLLNVAGIGIHPELVHALAAEYGGGVATHDEIGAIQRALERWFLYPNGETGPPRTTHELRSTLYLRQLAREHVARQASNGSRRRTRSEPRTARCLDALFRLCDDDERRAALLDEFPGSAVLQSVADDPQATADEYVEAVFEVGKRWPVLAPLFGTSESARYALPGTCSDWRRNWVVPVRGHAHLDRGAYDEARAEYDRLLEATRESDDRKREADSLGNLGLVAYRQGDYDDARDRYESARELFTDLGAVRDELFVRYKRVLLELDTGNPEAARAHHEAAMERLDDIERDLPDEPAEFEDLRERLGED
jgi:tetratricopeptide (TPR) repeat protein